MKHTQRVAIIVCVAVVVFVCGAEKNVFEDLTKSVDYCPRAIYLKIGRRMENCEILMRIKSSLQTRLDNHYGSGNKKLKLKYIHVMQCNPKSFPKCNLHLHHFRYHWSVRNDDWAVALNYRRFLNHLVVAHLSAFEKHLYVFLLQPIRIC